MVTTTTVVDHQTNNGHQIDTMITVKVVVEVMVEVVGVVITVPVHTVVVTRDLVVAGTLVVVTTVKVEAGQGGIREVRQEVVHVVVVDIVIHTVQVVARPAMNEQVAVIVMTRVNVLANDGVLRLMPVIVVQGVRVKVEVQVQVSHLTLMLVVRVSLIRRLQQTVNRQLALVARRRKVPVGHRRKRLLLQQLLLRRVE
jgi:hypothetical protein